uniref:Uncharacterized protein n=1 Tax=Leersia perrieri TaxID=77586 RepID=A0A0D9XSI6_9ORYZ
MEEQGLTVGSPEELRAVAEKASASESEDGLRVAVSGVRVSQAQELLTLIRDHVEAKLWGVDDEAASMAALKAAADGAARIVALSDALDAVMRDTEDRIPVPATALLRELACAVGSQKPPPFLPNRYTLAGYDALEIGKQAEAISFFRFSSSGDHRFRQKGLESSVWYFRQTAPKARARMDLLLGMTIPFEDPPIVIHILNASTWEARYYSNSQENM